MMFTSLLVTDNKTTSVLEDSPFLEDSWPGGMSHSLVGDSIEDANAIDVFRRQLDLLAIATTFTSNSTSRTTESSNFTIHYAEADCGLFLCQLINSHKFRSWLSPLRLLKVCQFDPTLSNRYIYCCQYQNQQNTSHYLTVWSKAELTPLQQFCVEQQARYMGQQQQQQRIDFLEDVIGKVSHQLRTPLASIELYADSLRTRLTTPDEREQANAIQQLAHTLSMALKRLTSNYASTTTSQHDLQSIAQNSIHELRPHLDQKQISLVGERPNYFLTVDSWQLQQVFNNLISNAIAFSPKNGIIDVGWHGYDSEVLIEIRDQGPGFSPEDLRNLFNRYYSRRPDGQGLGLAIAQKIVHDHGGNIWAKNLPQGGAHISISLPRHC